MRWALIWASVVCAGVAVGFSAGVALDATFAYISRDYVYLPQAFRYDGAVVGLLAGAVAAASAIGGPRPLPRPAEIAVALGYGVAAVILFALAGGFIGGVLGKTRRTLAADQQLAPIARVFACEGLWLGALGGALAGTAVACVMLRRLRRIGAVPPE